MLEFDGHCARQEDGDSLQTSIIESTQATCKSSYILWWKLQEVTRFLPAFKDTEKSWRSRLIDNCPSKSQSAQATCESSFNLGWRLQKLQVLESCKKGCRLELENAQVCEMTNGTWLQLVRSCALSTVQLVPDFKLRSLQESSRYPQVVHRGRVEIRGYCFLIYNIQTEVLDLMCELIYQIQMFLQ